MMKVGVVTSIGMFGSVESRNLSETEKENFQQLAVYVDGETGQIKKVFLTSGKSLKEILQ